MVCTVKILWKNNFPWTSSVDTKIIKDQQTDFWNLIHTQMAKKFINFLLIFLKVFITFLKVRLAAKKEHFVRNQSTLIWICFLIGSMVMITIHCAHEIITVKELSLFSASELQLNSTSLFPYFSYFLTIKFIKILTVHLWSNVFWLQNMLVSY